MCIIWTGSIRRTSVTESVDLVSYQILNEFLNCTSDKYRQFWRAQDSCNKTYLNRKLFKTYEFQESQQLESLHWFCALWKGSSMSSRWEPIVSREHSTKFTFETDTLKLILIGTHTWKLTLLHSSRSQQLAQHSWHRLCVWTTQQSSSKSGTQQGKRG